MFNNYLKSAFRNSLREKGNTFLNLTGLTLGISCSLILFLIITYHNSFDSFHSKRDRIYRITNQTEENSGQDFQSGVPTVLPDAFRLDFPEAEEVAFTSYSSNELVIIPQHNGEVKKFLEEAGVVYTEPSFLKIFDWKILQGDGFKALDEPNEAIISKQWAIKYFGNEDVIGKIIKVAQQEYRIAALMESPPHNTDFPFQLMLSYITIKNEREAKGWGSIWSDEQCYFLLKENETITLLESRLPAFTKKYVGENDFNRIKYNLQPLTEMHFDDRYETYSYQTIPRALLFTFGIIAIILVGTACINFINLSTAEAIKRSKEIGIRKTMGSTRAQLVFQFLGETTFITSLAVLFSLAITQLSLGFINPFMELNLSLDFTQPVLFIYVILITISVSLLSGLYPAIIVSGYKPAQALKNQISNKNSTGYFLRRALVVFQFCISQFFIIGTIVIIKQTNYFHEKDLGFSKEAILIVPVPDAIVESKEENLNIKRTVRNEVARIPEVVEVSLGSAPPFSGSVSKTSFTLQGDSKEYVAQVKRVDSNYASLYELTLLAGRNIADLDTANGYLVNEELVRVAGYSNNEEILGKNLKLWGKEFPVVGVIKNFNTVSLANPIEATVLFNRSIDYRTLALKVNTPHVAKVIEAVRKSWESAYSEQLFEYEFLDDSIRKYYESERKMATLLSAFTFIAIFIGCLGLFGLATFMTNQKTKEIGVRKVLGASVESVVVMFSREYGKLIGLGFLIAAPIAGFVMQQFLNEFTYRIDLGVGVFAMGLGLTIIIAILTVGYKSFHAAVMNPVKSLRYE